MAARILILGGGFAGIEAVRYLGSFQKTYGLDIKLVNRHRWALFSPLMPDLISGRVYPDHMAFELEPFCRRRRVEFIHSHVERIDPENKTVQLTNGNLAADFILICMGCETNYHGNEEFKRSIPGLKSLHEGITIRKSTKKAIDRAAARPGAKANILVIGGGYTGIEVASHIALYASQYCGRPLGKLSQAVDILMVDHGDTILSNTTEGVRAWAKKFITSYGISVKTGATLQSLSGEHGAILTDQSAYDDALVIWTAGVKPGPVFEPSTFAVERTGRLEVDPYLRLPGHLNLFAAGDVAAARQSRQTVPLRMSVQFSRSGGRLAAANILRAIIGQPLVKFDPFDPGYVIPLGPGHAMSLILGHEMHGRLPFFLHYLMSIYRSWGWKNKLAVVKDLSAELLPWPGLLERHNRIDGIHRRYWQTNPPEPPR